MRTIARVAAERTQAVDLAVIRGYVTAEDRGLRAPASSTCTSREAERDLEAMQEAAGRQDIARVAQLAHRLKGSSAGLRRAIVGRTLSVALCRRLRGAGRERRAGGGRPANLQE